MLSPVALLPLLGVVSAGNEWKTILNARSGISQYESCDSYISSTYVYDYTPLGLTERSAYYDTVCGYPPCVGAMMLCCAELVANDTSMMEKIYKVAASNCAAYSSYTLEPSYYKEQYENATAYYRPNSEVTDHTLPIYFPTLPNMTETAEFCEANQTYYDNVDGGTWYSIGIVVYFFVIACIATCVNFMKHTGMASKLSNPYINKFRGYCTIPALLPNGSYGATSGFWKVFTTLIPNRVESLVSFGLAILQIVFYAMSYKQDLAALVFGTAERSLQRYIADRSGIMAFGKIPLLVLVSGRNNILIWLTGAKYSSFIQYHKVISRWMFVDTMIHSVGYTVYDGGVDTAEYASDLKRLYFVCGVIGTIIAGIMLLFAICPLRNYIYESFLYSHIILALCFMVMCWYHCRELGWCEWMIASYVLWGADRILRVVRCSMFGYRTAHMELISDDSFKVTVDKPSYFQSRPGQYGFVYFSDWFLWFQNHPFTLVDTGDQIEIFITAKRGITNRILKQLKKNGGKMDRKLVIEGPYGDHSPVEKYDNVLLIGGGAGVPGIADHAVKLSQLESKQAVKLIYVERTLSDAEIYLRDLVGQLKGTKVTVEMFLTREETGTTENYQLSAGESVNSETSTSEKDSEKEKDSAKDRVSLTSINFIHVKYGRPDIKRIVAEECAGANGSLAVAVCGPGKMVDQVRAATAKAIRESKYRIDLYDELQKW